MYEIKDSEIFAYHVGRNVYCKDCAGKEDLKDDITSDNIVLREDVEHNGVVEDLFFCSVCKKRIQ